VTKESCDKIAGWQFHYELFGLRLFLYIYIFASAILQILILLF